MTKRRNYNLFLSNCNCNSNCNRNCNCNCNCNCYGYFLKYSINTNNMKINYVENKKK